MVEMVFLFFVAIQPDLFRRFEQGIGTNDIGFDKRIRAGYRAVNMTLGSKMNDRIQFF